LEYYFKGTACGKTREQGRTAKELCGHPYNGEAIIVGAIVYFGAKDER
jgi:hypothetical protein